MKESTRQLGDYEEAVQFKPEDVKETIQQAKVERAE